jgi:putative ABC transport system permease protein
MQRSRGARLYAALLRALPEDVRRDDGADMEAFLAARLAEASNPLARTWIWARAVGDVLRHGIAQRLGAPAAGAGGIRDMSTELLIGASRDVRFAGRLLLRSPALSLVMIAVLALGMGALMLVFTLVHSVLLRPLPYPESERLVMLQELSERGQRMTVSYPNYVDWRDRSVEFEAMTAGYPAFSYIVTGRGEPFAARGMGVTQDFFAAVGVRPELGRPLGEEDHRPGAPRVIVVSHDFWVNRLHAERDLSTISLNLDGGEVPIIAGVMPPGFAIFEPADFWYAIEGRNAVDIRNAHNHWVVGRLARGSDLLRARAEMAVIAASLREAYPKDNEAAGVDLRPLVDEVTASARMPLLVLLIAAGLVLLLACANVAGALLARGRLRETEVAVRLAIGAGRARLLRQLLTEGLLLGVLAVVGGLGLAWAALRSLQVVAAGFVPRLDQASFGGSSLMFAVGVTIVTVMLFSLWPAIAVTRDAAVTLRGGSRGNTRGQSRLWKLLLGGEVALAIALVIATGLLLRSISAIFSADVGYHTEQVLSVHLPFTGPRYESAETRIRFVDELRRDLATVEGVVSLGFASDLPLNTRSRSGPVLVPPYADAEDPQEWDAQAGWRVADAEYFETLGIPLLAGRMMQDSDTRATPAVVVLNASLAERLWPGQDPIGREVRALWDFQGAHLRVIGVVGEARHWSRAAGEQPELYVHWRQRPEHMSGMYALIAYRGDAASVASRVRSRLAGLDPDLFATFRTFHDRVAETTADRRFTLIVLGAMGAVAFLIALIGTYAVVSHAVEQRRREVGIRLALGGTPRGLTRLMLRETLAWVAAGAAIGALAALAGGRVLESLLFGVSTHDPLTYAAAVVTFIGAAALATWIPARRAARVDPALTMRSS